MGADGEVFGVFEEALAGGILAQAVGEAGHGVEPAPVDGERAHAVEGRGLAIDGAGGRPGGAPGEFAEPRLAGFNDAAQIIDTLRSECDYVLVAVDQPTVVPMKRAHDPLTESLGVSSRSSAAAFSRPTAASRPCSAPTRRSGGSWNVSAPPSTHRWARTSPHGLHLIEVFPALALPVRYAFLGKMANKFN